MNIEIGKQGTHIDDSDDDDEAAKHLSPVSIQEMITTANAHQKILERHIKALELLMDDETLLSRKSHSVFFFTRSYWTLKSKEEEEKNSRS